MIPYVPDTHVFSFLPATCGLACTCLPELVLKLVLSKPWMTMNPATSPSHSWLDTSQHPSQLASGLQNLWPSCHQSVSQLACHRPVSESASVPLGSQSANQPAPQIVRLGLVCLLPAAFYPDPEDLEQALFLGIHQAILRGNLGDGAPKGKQGSRRAVDPLKLPARYRLSCPANQSLHCPVP